MKQIRKFPALIAISFFILSATNIHAATSSDEKLFNNLLEQRKKTETTSVLKELLSETNYNHNYGHEWDARLNITKGNATLRQTIKKTDLTTKHGEGTEIPLEKGDIINVLEDSEAEIRLYNKIVLRLYPNTEIQLITIDKKDTYIDLLQGYLVGKISTEIDKQYSVRLKTEYTNLTVEKADFALAYIPKTKSTGAAIFDTGKMSISTINENGLSLGLYILKDNQEIFYSAALPDKDEAGRLKDDPNYKAPDIDINPESINKLMELKRRQKRVRLILQEMKNEWKKYIQGERETIREKIIKEGDILISAPTIIMNRDNSNLINEIDPDELKKISEEQ